MKKRIEAGSRNAVADTAQPIAEKHLVRAQLIDRIGGLMQARRLRQADAARLFGVADADVSQMVHRYYENFSVERLLRFLVALGQDVEISITPDRGSGNVAQLRVTDGAGGPGAK